MKRLKWLHEHLPARVWDNLATVSILGLLAVLGVFAWRVVDLSTSSHRLASESQRLARENRRLASENRQRIDDIQRSRVESCQRTYEGIRQVFHPFLPPHPQGKQKRDIDKFNRTVDRLKSNCDQQTKP